MGIYLNPGNEKFRMAVNSEIYVDKTMLISEINKLIDTEKRFIAVSRPRRFGKSMAVNMLEAYYGKECDSERLFEPYKISRNEYFDDHLNRYNVIKINMQEFLSKKPDIDEMIAYLNKRIVRDFEKKYRNVIEDDEFLDEVLADVYAATGEKFIILIDEWDCLLREQKYDEAAQKKYLDFVRNLLKDKVYVALAYMTGILPIKKYGTHSALNMFEEYSMTEPQVYSEYFGFTEEEVTVLCRNYGMDFYGMKDWYDGYFLGDTCHIYNPRAVVAALSRKKFGNYWTRTETYEALKVYIDLNIDGLKDAIIMMMSGERVRINTARFQNDMTTLNSKDDVLTLLIHLGYVAYDSIDEKVYIPNYDKDSKKHSCIIEKVKND